MSERQGHMDHGRAPPVWRVSAAQEGLHAGPPPSVRAVLLPPEERGVSAAFLEHFTTLAGQDARGVSARGIHRRVIVPATQASMCCYIELPEVGEP